MKRIDVQVTGEQHERLRQIAFRHETSIRALVTEAVIAVANGVIEVGTQTVTVERQQVTFGRPVEPVAESKGRRAGR